jgi:hypothetical protein
MSFGIEGSFRRDILGLLVTHYASPHTKFLTVPDNRQPSLHSVAPDRTQMPARLLACSPAPVMPSPD